MTMRTKKNTVLGAEATTPRCRKSTSSYNIKSQVHQQLQY